MWFRSLLSKSLDFLAKYYSSSCIYVRLVYCVEWGMTTYCRGMPHSLQTRVNIVWKRERGVIWKGCLFIEFCYLVTSKVTIECDQDVWQIDVSVIGAPLLKPWRWKLEMFGWNMVGDSSQKGFKPVLINQRLFKVCTFRKVINCYQNGTCLNESRVDIPHTFS